MDAFSALQRAFEARADGTAPGGAARVGLFGDGCAEAFIRAAGARPVDVKAPPLSDAASGPDIPAVREIAEPFLDDFAARFLHRFAAGAFDNFAMIVFARDDVAALTAYQYAAEMRRLGMVAQTGPALHLWNLTHAISAPAARFNEAELARLDQALRAAVGQGIDPDALRAAQRAEAARATALARHEAHPEAFTLRNAGRYLSPGDHAALLAEIAAPETPPETPPETAPEPRRVGLVGTACDTPDLARLAGRFGTLAADLTGYGDLWPGIHAGQGGARDHVAALAGDPLHIRANPPARFNAARDARLAGCDLVIAAVDRNDDSFGWDIPALAAATRARGAVFVDLGFRPFRPDAAWIDTAAGKIREAMA